LNYKDYNSLWHYGRILYFLQKLINNRVVKALEEYMKNFIFQITIIVFILYTCSFLDDELRRPPFDIYHRENGIDYLEVIAIGDSGTGGTGQIQTALSMKHYAENIPINFVLYLGDNCYPGGFSSLYDHKWQTCFENIYDDSVLDIPFFALLGNHDYLGNVDAQLEYSRTFDTNFTLPSKYYTFSKILPDSTEIQFIILDTQLIKEEIPAGDAELIWLENQLSASTAHWKIVIGHHPIYSNGDHGNNDILITKINSLLIDNNVDLYIAGHEHNLELIKNETGPYYIISGAGSQIRGFHSGQNTIYGANFLGMCVLRFSFHEMIMMFLIDDNIIDYSIKITK
jgi:tartrate-resistant acid phosphatase type 5